MKKILIATYAFPPKVSGVGDVVNDFATYITENGDCEVTILTSDTIEQKTVINPHLSVITYTSNLLLGSRIPITSISLIKNTLDIFKHNRPDIVHLHTRFSFDNIVILLLAKYFGITTVLIEHLSSHIKGESFVVNTLSFVWDQTISRFLFWQVNKIVAISHSVSTFLEQSFGVKSKVVTIPNALGSQDLAQSVSFTQKFAKSPKTWRLVFASRHVALKNPLLVIEAIKLLAHANINIHANISGDGPLHQKVLEAIAQYHLEKHITCYGRLSHTENIQLIADSDILLNPSHIEGLPGVVLEAINYGTIPIVSNVGGNNELVTLPELLIDLDKLTPKKLAETIIHTINNYKILLPELDLLQSTCQKYYQWDRVTKDYINNNII